MQVFCRCGWCRDCVPTDCGGMWQYLLIHAAHHGCNYFRLPPTRPIFVAFVFLLMLGGLAPAVRPSGCRQTRMHMHMHMHMHVHAHAYAHAGVHMNMRMLIRTCICMCIRSHKSRLGCELICIVNRRVHWDGLAVDVCVCVCVCVCTYVYMRVYASFTPCTRRRCNTAKDYSTRYEHAPLPCDAPTAR